MFPTTLVKVGLGCGHLADMVIVPPILLVQLFGAQKAYRMAVEQEAKRARNFACNKHTCRVYTGLPVHESEEPC